MLIGLGGLKESGKDALADELVRNHGFVKMGMSDALLKAAIVVDPYIPISDHEPMNGVTITGNCVRLSVLVERVGYVEAKKRPEVRRFIQVLGTDFGRNMVYPDLWVDLMWDLILEKQSSHDNIVVTGIRFPNELEMIENNGHSAWVNRPGLKVDSNSGHASENSLTATDFSMTIENSGTLEDLYALVPQMMEILNDR